MSDSPRQRILLVEDAPSLGHLFSNALVEAGFEVEWVRDVGQAIESANKAAPDLLAVDDLLDGERAADGLPELLEASGDGVRLVTMSSRAEEAAVLYAQLGAAECLAKPLPPRVLADRCKFILADGAAEPRAETDPFVVVTPGEVESPPSGVAHPMLAMVAGALRRALEVRLGDEEAAADMARVLLEDEDVARTLPAADMVFDADLSGVSMVHIIQLLALEQQSGVLRAERPGIAAELTFGDGRLDLAACPPAPDSELLAMALATGGAMEIELARRRVAGLDRRKPLIAQVLEKEWIKPADLRRAVAEGVRSALFEVLKWREGRVTFRIRPSLSALATDLGLSLPIDRLLMEGARRIDEWHVLEKRLPDPNAVYVREEGRLTPELRETLTPQERAVLDLLDGRTTLDELMDKAEIPSYAVQSLLHRLITLRLVDRRAAPALVEGA